MARGGYLEPLLEEPRDIFSKVPQHRLQATPFLCLERHLLDEGVRSSVSRNSWNGVMFRSSR